MGSHFHRVVGFLATCFVILPAHSMFAADPGFTLQDMGQGVWVAIATDTGRAGGNAGVVIGEDGIAIIDTFEHPDAAQVLLREIRKISQLPIRYVVNTHYHLDHVNGNDVFAKVGAVVVAHRNVRTWMRTENLKWWGNAIKPEDKARVQSLKLADVVYDDQVDLFLGSRRLEVRFYPGHTGGDTVVSIPDGHVVFCGDLLWKDHVPNLIDATTAQWGITLSTLSRNYPQFIFIPGHGGTARMPDITTFAGYLAVLRAAVGNAQSRGQSGDVLVNAVLPGLKEKYGSWGFFEDFAKDNIVQTAQELAGQKRVPQPAKAEGKQ